MRPNQITIEGIRAVDRTVELAPLTLLQGGVGSGKTSVCDGIRIALLGCVPSIGRDSKAIERLMRDGQILATLAFDDGTSVRRSFVRQGQSIRGDVELTRFGHGINDPSELVGNDRTEAAENLDLRQLLSCTPSERAKKMLAMTEGKGMVHDDAHKWIDAYYLLRLADVPPGSMPRDMKAARAAANGIKAAVAEKYAGQVDTIDEVMHGIAAAICGSQISDSIEWTNGQKKDAVRRQKRAMEAFAKLEDDLIEAGGDLDHEAAGAELERLRDEKAKAERDLEEAARVERIRGRFAPVVPTLNDAATEALHDFEEARAQLGNAEVLETEAEALTEPEPVVAPVAVEPDAEKMAEADRLEESAADIKVPQELFAVAEQHAVNQLEDAISDAVDSPWVEVREIADEIASADEGGRYRASTDRLHELSIRNVGDIDKANEALREEREKLAKAEEAVKARNAEIEVAHAKRREILDRVKAIRQESAREAREENERRRKEYAKAEGERAAKAAEIGDQRRDLMTRAKRIRDAASDAQRRLDKARADLAEAKAKLDGIESVSIDQEKAKATLAEAAAKIPALETSLRAYRRAETLREEKRETQKSIKALDCEVAAWKAAEWAMKRVREIDLAQRSEGLASKIARYLKAAGRTETPFLRAENGRCDFGWTRDGRDISVEALSGGETALYCAALAGAVVSLRAPKVRMVLVEAAELGSGDEAQQLLAACQEMVTSGDIDQAIVATCLSIEAPEAWSVVDLSREAVSA